jgi:hypothetical protein
MPTTCRKSSCQLQSSRLKNDRSETLEDQLRSITELRSHVHQEVFALGLERLRSVAHLNLPGGWAPMILRQPATFYKVLMSISSCRRKYGRYRLLPYIHVKATLHSLPTCIVEEVAQLCILHTGCRRIRRLSPLNIRWPDTVFCGQMVVLEARCPWLASTQ